MEEITIDFAYIDEYLNNIFNKIKTTGTITMYNGYDNVVYFLEKNNEESDLRINQYRSIEINGNIRIKFEHITHEELVFDFIEMFKSSIGTVNIMYRVYVGQYNGNTNGEFRELWGDILYVDSESYKLTKQNIPSDKIANVLINLELTEEEVKHFGKPEEYIFMDEEGEVIMGLDLI